MSTTQDFKKLLDRAVRSLVVTHKRGQHTHKVGNRRVKTAEMIGMTRELCLRSIRQVIDNGFPDWKRSLGSSNQ